MTRRYLFLLAAAIVMIYFSIIIFMLSPLHGARDSFFERGSLNNFAYRQLPALHWCQGLQWQSPPFPQVVALVSFPGSGNTWLRYLLQQATGIVTGSVYMDYGLRVHGFPAENVTDGSVLVVKTHEAPPIDPSKFKSALLLIRNPRDAILADFNRVHKGHIGTASKSAFKKKSNNRDKTDWAYYVASQLTAWESLHRLWLTRFPGSVHVVFYEALVSDTRGVLQGLLEFLNHTVTEVEMNCAISNKEGIYRRRKKIKDFDPYSAEMYRAIWTARDKVLSMVNHYQYFKRANVTGKDIAAISGYLIDAASAPLEASVRLRTPISRFAWTTDITTSLLLASTAAYGGHSRLKAMIKCLRQCQKMKYTLGAETENYPEERRKTGIFLIVIFIILVLIFLDFYLLIISVLNDHQNLAVAILFSSYEISYIMALLLEMQFVFSAFEIHSVLKSMNKALKHILVSRKTQDLGPSSHLSKRVPEAIQQLAAMYDEICTQVWKLGEANNMALAMLLGIFILRMVITSYNFITNFGSNLSPSLWVTMLPIWCFVQLLGLVIMVEPPHLTEVEMERASFLICRLENKFSDLEVSYELAKFSLYAALNKVCYSPVGVCKLSRSLVYSILGILTTYIIIILQFQS